ncbi:MULTISPECIES: hypothetical protein [Nocardioides]|uniref:Uncharacterized protein n=1 Tax=Nocardioides vastitatis TaxID=2568655 RepID=A0ABW0ZKD9_9ACTN|nr:hypothetical protein [Nocardioides sp.]
MTWHTVFAATGDYQRLLRAIRQEGGVVTGSRPCPAGYVVVYVIHEH